MLSAIAGVAFGYIAGVGNAGGIFINKVYGLSGIVKGVLVNDGKNESGEDGKFKGKGENYSIPVDRMNYDQVKKQIEELLGRGTLRTAEDVSEFVKLMNRLGQLFPRKALSELDSYPTMGLRKLAYGGIITEWTSHDPESAVQYYKAVSDDFHSPGLASIIVSEWMDNDPDKAWAFISELSSREKDRIIDSVIWKLSYTNPELLGKCMLSKEMPEKKC